MRVGVTVDPKDYDARLKLYPGPAVCRVFGPPGSGIPRWTDRRVQFLLRRGIMPHVSFKDWGRDDTDASAAQQIDSWLDEVPQQAPGPVVARLTYMHEPEPKNFDDRLYRRRQMYLAELIAAHRNGRWVRQVCIQTLQWTASGKAGKGRGDFSRYYAGVGELGMDCYADSWASNYPSPAKFLEIPLRLADSAGQPLIVPELGARRLDFDTTGERRAHWIRTVCDRLRMEGCTAVSWWDDLGGDKDGSATDYRLEDEPSRQAWCEVMTANHS